MKVNTFTNANPVQLKKAESTTSQTPAMKLNSLQQDTISFSGKNKVAKKAVNPLKGIVKTMKKDPTANIPNHDPLNEYAKIAGLKESKNFEGFESHLRFKNPVYQGAQS